jgi:hypothetical protein
LVNGERKRADPEEFKSKQYKRHIMNALDLIDSELWTLELMKETPQVDGEDCYQIKAVSAGSETKLIYFSKTSFLLLREDNISNSEKGKYRSTYFSDFKQFGKLRYYTQLRFRDGEEKTEAKILNLWINEKISDKDFQK